MHPWLAFTKDFTQLFFPHHCLACGGDHLPPSAGLCFHCANKLPLTHDFERADNPAEKTFWGRVPLAAAGALYHYAPGTVLQEILHRLKYHHQPQWGHFLGRAMGRALSQSPRFASVDALVPVPLHPHKMRSRGYNQAECIAQGIQETWNKPVLTTALVKLTLGQSQTQKSRLTRWEALQNSFALGATASLLHQHLLLVDDVLTTGATLEACAQQLLRIPGLRLSVATAAHTIS